MLSRYFIPFLTFFFLLSRLLHASNCSDLTLTVYIGTQPADVHNSSSIELIERLTEDGLKFRAIQAALKKSEQQNEGGLILSATYLAEFERSHDDFSSGEPELIAAAHAVLTSTQRLNITRNPHSEVFKATVRYQDASDKLTAIAVDGMRYRALTRALELCFNNGYLFCTDGGAEGIITQTSAHIDGYHSVEAGVQGYGRANNFDGEDTIPMEYDLTLENTNAAKFHAFEQAIIAARHENISNIALRIVNALEPGSFSNIQTQVELEELHRNGALEEATINKGRKYPRVLSHDAEMAGYGDRRLFRATVSEVPQGFKAGQEFKGTVADRWWDGGPTTYAARSYTALKKAMLVCASAGYTLCAYEGRKLVDRNIEVTVRGFNPDTQLM